MKTFATRVAWVFLLVALVLADIFYWTVSFPLARKLPQERVTKVQLWYYDEFFDSREIVVEGDALEKLVADVEEERVTNRSQFTRMSDPYFYLLLYYGDGPPWTLTIVENGDIALAPALDTDRSRYFDSGDALYQNLQMLTKKLSAAAYMGEETNRF